MLFPDAFECNAKKRQRTYSILHTTFPVLSLQQSIAGLLQLETSGRVFTAACMCSFHLKMDFYSFGVDYMVLNGKNMGFSDPGSEQGLFIGL